MRVAFKIPKKVKIQDGPALKYRGLLIDTVRNYIPLEDIKRTIGKFGKFPKYRNNVRFN